MKNEHTSIQNFPQVEHDGKIAVLHAPRFGAGWSTWNDNDIALLLMTHRELVEAVQHEKDSAVIREIAERLVREAKGNPEEYVCALAADDLKIEWIDKGSQFEVEEYDGSETIHVIGRRKYFTV
jgi:hypothetical protein